MPTLGWRWLFFISSLPLLIFICCCKVRIFVSFDWDRGEKIRPRKTRVMGHCSSIYRALHIIFKKQTKKKAKAHHPFPLRGPCFASPFVRFAGRMNMMVHLKTGECCAFTDVTLVKSRLNVVTSFACWRRCKTCG